MDKGDFVARIQELSTRLSYLGVGETFTGWTLSDLWGVYVLLRRLAENGHGL